MSTIFEFIKGRISMKVTIIFLSLLFLMSCNERRAFKSYGKAYRIYNQKFKEITSNELLYEDALNEISNAINLSNENELLSKSFLLRSDLLTLRKKHFEAIKNLQNGIHHYNLWLENLKSNNLDRHFDYCFKSIYHTKIALNFSCLALIESPNNSFRYDDSIFKYCKIAISEVGNIPYQTESGRFIVEETKINFAYSFISSIFESKRRYIEAYFCRQMCCELDPEDKDYQESQKNIISKMNQDELKTVIQLQSKDLNNIINDII